MYKVNTLTPHTRAGFTMIELMVVLAVIGILVMGMFKLVGVTSGKAQHAETVATLERVKNALSGYYAMYGSYPPVKTLYAPLDPNASNFDEYWDVKSAEEVKDLDNVEIPYAKFANFSARAQPMAFEFPNKKNRESVINIFNKGEAVALSTRTPNLTLTDWAENKLFKFGLMSFLVPRIELMVVRSDNSASVLWNEQNDNAVRFEFFESSQWEAQNTPAPKSGNSNPEKIAILEKQLMAENDACAKWLPNFEKRLFITNPGVILGVNLRRDSTGENQSYARYSGSSGSFILMKVTIVDGWGHELFYYSEPPYQSYRLWSAGPNGATFPPWLDTNQYLSGNFSKCREWMADDVVSFDR